MGALTLLRDRAEAAAYARAIMPALQKAAPSSRRNYPCDSRICGCEVISQQEGVLAQRLLNQCVPLLQAGDRGVSCFGADCWIE